jgi:long-chain acyl-CoA synthetase
MKTSEWTIEVEPARAARDGVPAAGPVYKCAKAKDGFPHLTDVSTCYELFQRSVKLYPDRPCLGYRNVVDGQVQPFTYITYTEAGLRAAHVGSAMSAVGLKEQGRVGVFGANSPEWMIALQVTLAFFRRTCFVFYTPTALTAPGLAALKFAQLVFSYAHHLLTTTTRQWVC